MPKLFAKFDSFDKITNRSSIILELYFFDQTVM